MNRSACVTIASVLLVVSNVSSAQQGNKTFNQTLDELFTSVDDVSKKEPKCLVDANGLPHRVLITCNGTALFEKPDLGAQQLRILGVYDRLYLYVKDDGNGFHHVGTNPWGDGLLGWIPSAFCLVWDHNEMLFLSKDSVRGNLDRLHIWQSLDDARKADPTNVIAHPTIAKTNDRSAYIFFPILEKDKSGRFYKIGFILGGDQGSKDEYGQPLSQEQRQQIVDNLNTLNLMFVVEATDQTHKFLEEVATKVTSLFDELRKLGPNEITIRLGLVLYADRPEQFDSKVLLPLTANRDHIDQALSPLLHTDGSVFLLPAVRKGLGDNSFGRGAINRVVVIGATPPLERRRHALVTFGREVKSQYVQFDTFLCKDNDITQDAFSTIASASGGAAYKVNSPVETTKQLFENLKERVELMSSESTLLQLSLRENIPITEAAEKLELSEQVFRKIEKALVTRGANLALNQPYREGWVKVLPGTGSAIRVHVCITRWELARHLSQMLGTTDGITKRKDVQKNATSFIATVLTLLAGESANAGIALSRQTARDRAGSLPEVSPTIKRNESLVIRLNKANKQKILELLGYWREPSHTEHEYVWVPLDLLP